ncbi:phosphatidylinositol 4-kinase protein [Stemphylium lycopersici]|nr:phosphatidylinositol 4-kinase protein [Stemphylium lycopersici]
MLNSSDSHRRRKKDPDRERSRPRTKDKDRDRERHKSSHSRKTRSSASKDDDPANVPLPRRPSSERVRTSTSSSTLASSQASKSHKMAVVPEMARRGSLGSDNTSRISLPYPSHSKTYAKESIYSRDGVEKRRSAMTPEPTDAEASSTEKDDEPAATAQQPNRVPPPPSRAPPSPPLTATTAADMRRAASANSMRRKDPDMVAREMADGRQSVDSGTRMTSEYGPRVASRSSVREGDDFDGTDLTSTTGSQPSTIRAKSPHMAPMTKTASPSYTRAPARTSTPSRTSTPARTSTPVKTKTRAPSEYTLDSDATSVIQDHNAYPRDASPSQSEASPSSVVDSSPRTPTQHSVLPSDVSSVKDGPPMIEVMTDAMSRTQSVDPSYAQSPMTPPPPPPPPAMMEAPRVDYLLQNGGLAKAIPRSLLAAIDGVPASAYSQYTTPRLSGAQAHDVRSFFKPLQNVLNSYNTVMDTSGSLAVATGYRSVARRLLDRLENVFARNISSEHCQCMMCFEQPVVEDSAGVNWGEILELVSGRCELPSWPPYEEGPGPGLGISSDLEAPCQRIDVDVPEQYREHYEKQSKKTKVAVQSWLSDQQDNVPEDADDETLTFIMLTRLEQPQRPLFYALLWGLEKLPNPRTQKPDSGTPAYLAKAGLALQRLYRLHTTPRDQLTVMYLIRHPDMHNMLATLAAVTKHEWEILVSGRFDGFLWSGVEDVPDMNGAPARSGSRAGQMRPGDGPQRFASPFSPNRYGSFSPSPYSRPGSARPGSVRPPGGAPVQIDEETEIAVLAEIEREIYLGMEAMEDAFEQLHNQAEGVRRRLRERAAALSMVAQQRRGAGMGGIEVRTDTPANMRDADEGMDDLKSEIGPDDSASNVSNNRRRKAHRARERRTPAPVEEESEEEVALAERIRRRF